jgi:hypothetical protein
VPWPADLKELAALANVQPDWDDGLTDDEVLYIPNGKDDTIYTVVIFR